ncbi:hypothetical protein [Luteolibacter sp. AS25]|uniref:hypothetical protein n=1 Tax=Luteolibacter sp. AS25 TaxID=3135776 RepID=UPI00398B42BB
MKSFRFIVSCALAVFPLVSKAQQEKFVDENAAVKIDKVGSELSASGIVKKVEDAGYPILVITLSCGKEGEEMDFILDAEAVGVTETQLLEVKDGRAVKFHYTAEKLNNVYDIRIGEKSLFGISTPKVDPDWKAVSGILGGVEEETAGDLPEEITISDKNGEVVKLPVFVTREMVLANGSRVTAYYDDHVSHEITRVDL